MLMSVYWLHYGFIAVVATAALLFILRGRDRLSLLTMGLSAAFSAFWMFSVVRSEIEASAGIAPEFWVTMSQASFLPIFVFMALSLVLLGRYYAPQTPLAVRSWLPLAVIGMVIPLAHILFPQVFVRELVVAPPPAGRIELTPVVRLGITVGPAYYIHLLALVYVAFEIARLFPQMLRQMSMPIAEPRARLLLTAAVLVAVWQVLFEIVPVLLGTMAPGFLRIVGIGMALSGATYVLVLSRTLDPKEILESAVFYAFRILIVSIPLVFLFRHQFGASSAGILAVMVGVAILDFILMRLRQASERLSTQRLHFDAAALMQEFLALRNLRTLETTLGGFFRRTLGAREIRIWVPEPDNPQVLRDLSSRARVTLTGEHGQALAEWGRVLIPSDLQLDPHLVPVRETLSDVFDLLSGEVILPLVDEGRLIGFISFGHKETLDPYYQQDLEFLNRLTKPIALSLTNALLYESAGRRTSSQPLSRAEFDEMIEQRRAALGRDEQEGMVVMLRIADPEGFDSLHGAGSAAAFLRRAAESELSRLRALDLPAHYDEHTFVIFMPHTDLHGAGRAAQRLTARLEAFETEINGAPASARFRVMARDVQERRAFLEQGILEPA